MSRALARAALVPLVAAAPALVPLAAAPALAQTRPLRTVDPLPLRAGVFEAAAGVELLRERSYPLSGLTGDLVGLPVLAFAFGFGRAEFRVESGLDLLWIDARDPAAPFADMLDLDGDFAWDIRDPRVSTKVLLRHETARQPAVALRVAVKFPTASNASGLGTDAIDLYLTLAGGKDVGRARVAANVGLGVLSAPTEGHRQNDVLEYGLSIVRPLASRIALVAEAAGREALNDRDLPGTEDRGQTRLGLRWDAGRVRLDGAAIRGLNGPDEEWGLTVGVTAAWEAFENR